MKKHTLLLITLLPLMAIAQIGGITLSPEGGLSIPGSGFSASRMLGLPGYQLGLHLDKKWKGFGFGLYGGLLSNSMEYDYQLPQSNSGLSIQRIQNIKQGQQRQLFLGLGPLLSFHLSEKIGVEISSKFGFSKISYPDIEERVRLGTSQPEEYTLYRTSYETVTQTAYPMLLSSLRLHYGLGDRTSLFLSGSFNQVWNVRHSYSYLDGSFSPSFSNETLLDALRTAPTVSEIRKCIINSTGITTGISIQLGGSNPKPPFPVNPGPVLPEIDTLLTTFDNGCPKLQVFAEKQDVDRDSCCYKIVLQNQLDPKSSLFPAAFSVSISNGNITQVFGTQNGWMQMPAIVPQKTKMVTWQGPTFKIPPGQTNLATICVEGLTPMWLDFAWLYRADKEICHDAVQLNDCVNEPEDLCDNPLIRNSGFETNITPVSSAHWSIAYGSPKFVNTPTSGFLDIGHVEAKGNLTNGDAIVQTLDPFNKIHKGKNYLLSVAVRFFSNQNVSDYARIRAIALNGSLPVIGNKHPDLGTNLALIGRSTKIKDCGDWVIMEFFVWTANKDFDRIALNVFTDDGTIANLLIDNVSLCEVNYDPCAEIQLDSNNQPIRPPGLPPPPGNFACASEAEEVQYQNGSLSDLYGGAPYYYDGTTNWYANAMDNCFSIGGTIPDEVTNYNCDDSLKLAGINLTCDELQKMLEDPDLSNLAKYKPPKMPPIPDLPKGPPCIQLPDDMGNMAFAGKDIIYIHGLELGHVMDRISGLDKRALSNWPAAPQEFYRTGYYKRAADSTWVNHIEYFTKNKLIPENNYKNRYLVVSYNCSQRLDVAVHSVLSQIREAMAYGIGVVPQGDPRDSSCFGKEFVIISQSTGAMVADVLLTIANDTKTSPKMAKQYGNIGYIADRCKGHIARRGAFTGSDLATILVALAKPTPGATAIATGLLMQDGDIFKDLSDPNNFSIIRSSILVDLIPPIARSLWGPYIDRVPVKVLTVSGGHPTFFSKEQIDKIAQYGFGAGGSLAAIAPVIGSLTGVDPVSISVIGSIAANTLTLKTLQAALAMKYIVHPGFDDGVITTDCATGRKSTFLTPSTYQASNPIKAFDMGVPKIRAIGYFLDQKKKTDLKTFRSGATPYLSPTGMVQPVSTVSLNPSYKNHITFVQAAGEHWIKTDILSCEYNSTAISGDRNFEEQLVVNDAACFNPTSGIISPSIISLMKEEIRGKFIPIYYIKFRKVKGIPRPTIASRPFWIWKRTYHNMVQPNYQLSSQGCMLDCDYVYRYLFKN